jgi:hypothetical protein
MDKSGSLQRRKERLPWTIDEIRLWVGDISDRLDEWITILGEPKEGSEPWEFQQVLGDATSRLARLSWNLYRCGIEAAEPGELPED